MNNFLKARAGPNPILAALVATRPGELAGARPQEILWLSDPGKTIHRTLGLGRTQWGVFFQPGVLWKYMKAMFRGVYPQKSAKGEDLLQLGGDFLWDREGNLVWTYSSKDPTDRPSIETIARVLESKIH